MEKVRNIDNHTAFSFLALLRNLRWVILQDISVMIHKYNETSYIYKQFDKLFESGVFNDADQMVDHLKLSEKTDSNNLGRLTETVLPYANDNIKSMNGNIQNMIFVFENLTIDIKDSNLEIIGAFKTKIASVIKKRSGTN